jgi:uncharacterized membrane protein YhaH (DUF805 family)
MEMYIKCWKHCADFSSRASRAEFWSFFLTNLICSVVLSAIAYGLLYDYEFFSKLALCYSFAALVPGVAVCVRRLHDVGCSGFYILFNMIPLGSLYLLILILFPSEADNKYGPKPFSVKEKKSDKKGNGEGDNKENVKEIIDVEI